MKKDSRIFSKIITGLLAAALIFGHGAPGGDRLMERPGPPAVNSAAVISATGTKSEEDGGTAAESFTAYTYTDGTVSKRFLRLADTGKETLVKSGVTNQQTGTTVKTNRFGTIDWTHANDGWFTLSYHADTGSRVRGAVDFTDTNGKVTCYDLNLEKDKKYDIPVYCGEGKYTLSLLKHDHANQFEPMLAVTVQAKPNNAFDAFLRPTKNADFGAATNTVAKAEALTAGCQTDREKIEVVYNWVSENIVYAVEMMSSRTGKTEAETVYDLDWILSEKRGVCGHKSALMAGMLRSLHIPCKVVAGNGHAWISVWNETGTFMKDGVTYSVGDWLDLNSTSKGLIKNCAIEYIG